jgi:Uma2 family endonuclease
MTAIAQPQPRITADDFFEMPNPRHAGGKIELVNGHLRLQEHYASSGHATIQANLTGVIGNHLRAKRPSYRVTIGAGVQTTFDAKRNVRRPDVTVTCAPHEKRQRVLPDPVLIIQVMSPNNQDDQWETIRALASVATVMEIVVVDSETADVQVFSRDKNGVWPTEPERVTAGGTVHLASIEADVTVADIYWGTSFE